jgi:hypothetical protein
MPPSRLGSFLIALALTCAACGALRRGGGAEAVRPLDLNAAPVRRIEALPGVTPSMARRIVAGRPYDAPDDLVTRGILTERELERVRELVVVETAR